jgi:hypothetical protein
VFVGRIRKKLGVDCIQTVRSSHASSRMIPGNRQRFSNVIAPEGHAR